MTETRNASPDTLGGGLKPCPFCGGEAWLNDYEAKYSDLPPQSRSPQCRSCGVGLGYLPTKAKAIEAWNRRTAVPPHEGEVVAYDWRYLEFDGAGAKHLTRYDPRNPALHDQAWVKDVQPLYAAPSPKGKTEGEGMGTDEPIGGGLFLYRTTIMGERHIVEAASGFVRVKLPYNYGYTSNAQQRRDAEIIAASLSNPAQALPDGEVGE